MATQSTNFLGKFSQTLCFEEQARFVGIDNTFTRWDDTATYKLETDNGNGPTIPFEQLPVTGVGYPGGFWSEQIQEQWVKKIQTAADLAGVKWIVEAAFVYGNDPSNISGGGGLPGPLTSAIAEEFVANGMRARFVQITVCPGSPTPTRLTRCASALFTPAERELLITPTQLGPFREFRICEQCVDDEIKTIWFVRNNSPEPDPNRLEPFTWDKITESSQIPKCAVPCGTIAQAPSPTRPSCDVETLRGCDNGNVVGQDENGQDTFQEVNRIYQYCDGNVSISHTIDIDDGDGGVVPEEYQMRGTLVDCDSGEPLEDPPVPCGDFESLGKLYHYQAPEPATLVEWWADPDGTQSGTAVEHGNVSDIFSNDGSTLTHISGPADNSYIAPVFSVQGTNAGDFLNGMGGLATSDTSGTDQGKLSAFFNLRAKALIRDGGTRTGERGGFWLNECCKGNLELLQERTVDTTSAERGVFNNLELPAGIHYAEALISDLSAWWNLTLEASFDGGKTWEQLIGYQEKPNYVCIPVIKCKDNGVFLNALTGEALNPDDLYCEDPCADFETSQDLPQTLRIV